MTDGPLPVGVIGVGSMGQHHARVYSEMAESTLIGVSDVDEHRADEIAERYGTSGYALESLLSAVEAVSIAVPTQYHYEIAKACLEHDVNVLIEKPFVDDFDAGIELIEAADDRGLVLQVGHIERFNPAVQQLVDIVPQLDIIAVEARRLGPDPGRVIDDSVVTDLMIHDIDIISSLLNSEVDSIQAAGNANGRYAAATLRYENDIVGSLTASRTTEQKVRELHITAEERFIKMNYLDQSIEIHRQSAPEYVTDDGAVRYRHESIVERLAVDNIEPLKNELQSFLEAISTSSEPVVSGEDGLQAMQIAQDIDAIAFDGRSDLP